MDDAVAPTAGSGRAKGLGDLKALQPTLMGKYKSRSRNRRGLFVVLLCCATTQSGAMTSCGNGTKP